MQDSHACLLVDRRCRRSECKHPPSHPIEALSYKDKVKQILTKLNAIQIRLIQLF